MHFSEHIGPDSTNTLNRIAQKGLRLNWYQVRGINFGPRQNHLQHTVQSAIMTTKAAGSVIC